MTDDTKFTFAIMWALSKMDNFFLDFNERVHKDGLSEYQVYVILDKLGIDHDAYEEWLEDEK